MRTMTKAVSTLLVAVGLSACSPSPPNEERIKADLIGQELVIQQGVRLQRWRIEAGELKGFRVVRRMTDGKAGTDTILIAVNLEGLRERATGDLRVNYRRYDQGWQLATVGAAPGFSLSQRGNDAK